MRSKTIEDTAATAPLTPDIIAERFLDEQDRAIVWAIDNAVEHCDAVNNDKEPADSETSRWLFAEMKRGRLGARGQEQAVVDLLNEWLHV